MAFSKSALNPDTTPQAGIHATVETSKTDTLQGRYHVGILPLHCPLATAPFHVILPGKNGKHLQALPGCLLEFGMLQGAPAKPAHDTSLLNTKLREFGPGTRQCTVLTDAFAVHRTESCFTRCFATVSVNLFRQVAVRAHLVAKRASVARLAI